MLYVCISNELYKEKNDNGLFCERELTKTKKSLFSIFRARNLNTCMVKTMLMLVLFHF